MKEFIIRSAEEMKVFAGDIASRAEPGDVYCLAGNLGAGKTTFAQGFISSLQDTKEPVTSPTFNLVQIYKTARFPVYHCDFYRLKSENEFMNLGLEDAFDSAVTLIEWPEMIGGFLPEGSKYIKIEMLQDGTRKVTIN